MGVVSRERIETLTSLRFFAALAIVILHSKGLLLPADFLKDVPLNAGVSFFFVLSGFILSHVYSQKGVNDFYGFITSRVARVWPAHLAALIIFLAVLPVSEWVVGDVNAYLATAANFFLVHALIPIPAYYFSYNGPSWSISTELVFYFVFPFLLATSKLGLAIRWFAVIASGMLMVAIGDAINPEYFSVERFGEVSGNGLIYISPFVRVQEFFAGMLGFYVFSRIKSHLFGRVFICTALEFSAVFFLIVFFSRVGSLAYAFGDRHSLYLANFAIYIADGVMFSFIIGVFYVAQGLFSKVLSFWFLVVLGEISFSMYLLHQIFVRVIARHAELLEIVPYWARFVVFLIFVVALSYAMWRFVETPARFRLKMIFDFVRSRSRYLAVRNSA
ncbi:acyltransferase family protein [Pseudomonas panipatensis]|uniref:Peptidoglycan/LPS O-acetylase OafA/YrhL, contains acyltransferase and SGNH-hydrolase domains n=1 Tax=Pseudomonas panipatensis TaxID=428992 RepID=A0A1G8I970_9PSED|nr:acyltransferase [Pseudomonas panipatensis]SDI15525.1 Peptidoglycan/LPS O-acetylase OafA/YrhL, contains acyltransferase and SGNH-hydrolase domains [Pseudomonas panipatensis]SMP79147.1 Peptidoglycan/LPS O-acetylase OafA/YrhL, contains acyltransferase and SGNH-hydrolase domains [Pseudomonas panipatensis]